MKAINFKLIGLALLLLFGVTVTGQQIKPVSEGTIVPDTNLGHVLNGTNQKIMLGDLKGKLVILDFWNTACSSCIKGFPKMNALQKQFGDKIKVFLVTGSKEDDVNKLFGRIKPDIANLTVITGDTVLRKLFPHIAEPHHVWIDPNGVYRFATFDHNATEQNISKILDGKAGSITRKTDGLFDRNASLLLQAATKFSSGIEAYSVLLKGLYPYTNGGSVVFSYVSISGFASTFRGIGLSPLALLKCAFNKEVYGYEPGLYGKNSKMRLIVEVRDSLGLYVPTDPGKLDEWQNDNFLSYELKVRPRSPDDLYTAMQRELNAAFPYSGVVEMRQRQYLALVRIDHKDHLKTKNMGETIFADGFMDFKGIPLSMLLRHMNDNNRISQLPIIDETGINYSIDFRIKSSAFYNLDDLKKELNNQGLDIVRKQGPIPMLVIRDKQHMAP